MKSYGIPRIKDLDWPDLGDMKKFALKSSSGNIPTKSGDIRNSLRSSKQKRRIRKKYKQRERSSWKRHISL